MKEKLVSFRYKSKEIEKFVSMNGCYIFIGPIKNNEQFFKTNSIIDDNEVDVYVINESLGEQLQYRICDEIIGFLLSRYVFSDYIYTHVRLNINNEIYISNDADIRIKYLDESAKLYYVMKMYLKLNKIKEKYKLNDLIEMYSFINRKSSITSIFEKYDNFDVAFTLLNYKEIVECYKTETDEIIDLNEKIFCDNFVFKCLYNYFCKLIVVSYDEKKVSKFLLDYYKSNLLCEDNVYNFVKNMIYIYGVCQNIKFSIKTRYDIRDENSIFVERVKKLQKIKYKGFYKKFDSMMKLGDNYKRFLYMFELLEPYNIRSNKKQIIDYISIIELLLTHSPKNNFDSISKQFEQKVCELIKGYSAKELYYLYSYRSKVIHGEYNQILKILKKISKLDVYKFNLLDMRDYELLSFDNVIEYKIRKRVNNLVNKLILKFIKNYEYINDLKNRPVFISDEQIDK